MEAAVRELSKLKSPRKREGPGVRVAAAAVLTISSNRPGGRMLHAAAE
jgi:hypothetical protein